MSLHLHNFGTLSIPNAGTDTPAYAVQSALGSSMSVVVFAPAALTAAVTVQVAPVANPQAADWKTLQLTGTGAPSDITIAAGKAVAISLSAGYRAFRLHSAGAEAAQRDFIV